MALPESEIREMLDSPSGHYDVSINNAVQKHIVEIQEDPKYIRIFLDLTKENYEHDLGFGKIPGNVKSLSPLRATCYFLRYNYLRSLNSSVDRQRNRDKRAALSSFSRGFSSMISPLLAVETATIIGVNEAAFSIAESEIKASRLDAETQLTPIYQEKSDEIDRFMPFYTHQNGHDILAQRYRDYIYDETADGLMLSGAMFAWKVYDRVYLHAQRMFPGGGPLDQPQK